MENNERTAIIQASIKAGNDKEGTKRELISHGLDTAGLEEEYETVLSTLGMQEPVPQVPEYISALRSDSGEPLLQTQPVSVPFRIVLQAGVSVGAGAWRTLLGVSLLALMPQLALLLLGMLMHVPGLAVLLVLICGLFIHVLVYGMVLYIGSSDGEAPFTNALQWSVSHFIPILWLSFFLLCVVLGGSVFLVIPGILILFCSAFAFIVLAKENARGSSALMRSLDLVNGVLFRTALQVSALVLIFGLPMLLLSTAAVALSGSFATLPIAYVCTALSAALGVAATASLASMYQARTETKPLFDYSAYKGIKWIYRLLFLIGLGIAAVFIIGSNALSFLFNSPLMTELESLKGPEQTIQNQDDASGSFNVGSFILQSKVESTAASARIVGARMGDHNGVCQDITVVAPVECRSNAASFVVFAPLQSGGSYCVDASGFSGTVAAPAGFSCQ